MMLGFDDRTGRLLASGGRFELPVYINGEVQRIGYFGELRAEGGLRNRRSLLLGSYRKMREFHEAGDVLFYLTTIIADNSAARRLLEAGIGDMPTYRPLEPMITFTIPVLAGSRRRPRQAVATADSTAVSAIAERLASRGARYQFHPAWDAATLQSADRCRDLSPGDFLLVQDASGLRGCLALWDQRAFKQTVIRGYGGTLRRMRPALNLIAPMLRRPRLPDAGARLESAFLSHVSVATDDAETLVSLVGQACRNAAQRGLDYVMISFAGRNPLARVVRKNFPCHDYVSMIYVVYWEDGATAAAQLDNRIPHPEVAIL